MPVGRVSIQKVSCKSVPVAQFMSADTQHYWSTDDVNPRPGEEVNGYTIIDIIKATNFSIVYAGFDISTGEKVVLKFVKRTKGRETLI